MSTKLSFVVLFVCVIAMQLGLLASVPLANAMLPWMAVVALVSVCWPVVAMVLGLFGVLAFDKAGSPQMEFDLGKPGHKLGYMAYIFTGRTINMVRKGASSLLHKAGKWTEPKTASKKVKVVSPLFGKD